MRYVRVEVHPKSGDKHRASTRLSRTRMLERILSMLRREGISEASSRMSINDQVSSLPLIG